ncbi:MAG: DNA polymerase domain-containing protein [Candidatus Thermoplasmatota archaeon]|jgi:DNA polymerase elongation subunit (family B)|nr:DNA polymerase domain-containing protein [Candidatus Thermoplasmatota archaeon]
MSDTLIGVSPDYLYYHKKPPQLISELHKPYFLVFCQKNEDLEKNRQELIKKLETKNSETDQLNKIEKISEIEDYKSFWDFNKKRKVFKVYTKKSYFVPEVSDHLFFNHDFYTAEHDIPYHQRALLDLAANGTTWLFDTNNEKKKLKIIVYDIETTEYEEGKNDVPIDIIGYSSFDLVFESSKNLEKEEFSFNILDIPSNWEDLEVKQLVSHNIDEEIKNLYDMCKILGGCDIVSGHNIVGFDNFHLYGRINWILKNNHENLSEDEKKIFQCFINKYCRLDKSFHFGVGSEVVQLYPTCFDTYLAARKFYSFLDEFSLKTLAPFLGVVVKDRVFLSPSQIKIDARTLKYNKQDVQEQIGVTLNLIQQALPLAFITCMPFDMLLPAGAVNIWDHMALLRGVVQKKIMPPICRVKSISQVLVRDFNDCKTREDIIKKAKKKREQLSKDFVRVLKYGDEMPEWVEYPYVIYNERAVDDEESLSYHMPGGMTIKPDKEARSDFIPWYHVVVADVGAMYPTILKAMNIGADTVKLASKKEKPDAYIWLKKLPERFFEERDVFWREINLEDSYADKGYILGVKIDDSLGVVNQAMTSIMNMIAKIKKELKEAEKKGDKAELQRLKMMYQSMKGARNAGTHGILAAPTVTGRQFNLWGAAAITTKGQMILADTLKYLENKNIRVVYGDTDGIYLGCSRSAGNLPNFSKTLGIPQNPDEKAWLTKPEVAINAIEECDKKWQKNLNYPDFELEPEIHDCMIFVKHKNYLIFDEKDGKIEMITKGNNFKGSDKANIARKVLEEIMMLVLKENPCWDDEEKARCMVKNSIKNKTREVLSKLDLSKVDLDDLTLVQSVQPSKRYKTIQDGSPSVFGKRSAALEKLLGQPVRTRIKLKFVVTKKPLPGITNPSKSGVKPIDYMYPVDLLKNTNEIDLEWYKKMIENYIQGAFGLSDISTTEQKGLDAWM